MISIISNQIQSKGNAGNWPSIPLFSCGVLVTMYKENFCPPPPPPPLNKKGLLAMSIVKNCKMTFFFSRYNQSTGLVKVETNLIKVKSTPIGEDQQVSLQMHIGLY